MTNDLVVLNGNEPMTARDLQQQVNAIQEAMAQVMKEDTHYGRIEGCGNKPSLFKPGAEKLGFMFRFVPQFDIRREDLENGHREFQITCTLVNQAGRVVGQGVGSATTMESKFRYRGSTERICPECSVAAIKKGSKKFGGGWYCDRKLDGCGGKFKDGDKAIESQDATKKENLDIADTYNTVLKMAKKRAHVDAILTATAASDIFTQDIEDLPDAPEAIDPKPAQTPPPPPPRFESRFYRIKNESERQTLYMRTVGVFLNDVKAWRIDRKLSDEAFARLEQHRIEWEQLEAEQAQAIEPDEMPVEPKESPLEKAKKRAAEMTAGEKATGALAKLEQLKAEMGGK